MSFKLTNDQQVAYDYLTKEFPSSPPGTLVLLTGEAGTGKTTLQVNVLKDWIDTLQQVTLTALTHKAAAVVRQVAADNEISASVGTIHSALKLLLKNDRMTGESWLEQTKQPEMPYGSILSIDEISMADDEMIGFIRGVAENMGLRVLMIGDSNQLPPVKQVHPVGHELEGQPRMSSVFAAEDVKRFVLKETVRQPGASPIVDLARVFIESHEMPRMDKVIENEHGRVELVNHTELMTRAKELVQYGHDNNEPNHVIVLAHKNNAVINYNSKLRAHVWGDKPLFQPGERLIVNEQSKGTDRDGCKVDVLNNEVVVVQQSKQTAVHGMRGYDITLQDGRNVFAVENVGQLIQTKKQMAKEKNWLVYFQLKEEVVDLRSAYAVTVHKSQSSTYRHVLIDMGDIFDGNDTVMLQKLCYTAMTRASKSVSLAGYEVFWSQPSLLFAGEA